MRFEYLTMETSILGVEAVGAGKRRVTSVVGPHEEHGGPIGRNIFEQEEATALRRLGAAAWELASVCQIGDQEATRTFYFKRGRLP